jgi:hypothetical protein
MSVADFVKGVVADVLQDMLRKSSASKRAKRRKRTTNMTVAERLRKLEREVSKPAKRQTSKRKTVAARSKAKRRSY